VTGFSRSPRTARGGLVVLDSTTEAVVRTITFQYNPETLTRTTQARGAGGETGGDAAEALRLTGPPTETITLDAELDVTDELERPDEHGTEVELGLLPRLAALEALVYPASDAVLRNDELARAGTVEILPTPGPLVLFAWSSDRVLPVQLTELIIAEEAFDTRLRPTRARVSLSLRVLTVTELGTGGLAGSLAMVRHQTIERHAALEPGGTLEDLGIASLT
jgi:hypothetical protein